MFCYYLNCRHFLSKSSKDCYMLTVASPLGDVSDFFISKELFNSFSENSAPFDYIRLDMTFGRNGSPVVSNYEPALLPTKEV